jgi:nucleotide-binding universal stress UspA family protein
VASVASCSVAIIPDIAFGGRTGVVVGVADGGGSNDAVAVGATEAARLGHDLMLVHAGPAGREAERALLGEASEHAMAAAPGIHVHTRVSRRVPAEALLDASRAAALLVLGGSRRDPDGAGFIGSVIHEVLLNINAPVLVARRPADS